ncbi:hypothetical protein [Stenotrophomonas nematodicola]|uniref:hypothetical protein n=1 Tax=Stenotrophomonas nematodicola TaxID=2656746 RepID=UPI001290BDEE|nr:hypothetical protein [Stenotrophomonas nematodicola]
MADKIKHKPIIEAPTPAVIASTLRAMVRNYGEAHHWNPLDARMCAAAADRIESLEECLNARQPRAVDERAFDQAIEQRDRYHGTADELADHIARITGVDIGEHSSVNCPWQNAIEAAAECKPAQGIDLEKVRQLIGDLRTLDVKESSKNDNAGFVDLRCYWAVLGIAGEVERSMIDQRVAAPGAQEPVDDDWHLRGYAYASKQATTCAGCGKHTHTPLRIDAMGGYVCLTCIDQKLGAMLGEFEYLPAQGIDLGPLVAELAAADSEYAEAKKRYHTVSAMSGAAGGRASCRTAYERELTAKSRLDAAVRTLIDQRDAAPGVGNG